MTDISHVRQAVNPEPAAVLAELAQQLGRADRSWAILAEGNVGSLTADGIVHVKASGAWMSRAQPSDFVQVPHADLLALIDDPASDDRSVQQAFDGVAERSHGRRPSVESLLHAVCLDQPGVNVVGHTHPVAVNALLCSPRAELMVEGALFPDQVVVLGVRPLLVPYIDPGLKLAQAVRRMVRERPDVPRVIYLENHGLFALGSSVGEVLQITEMADKVARVIAAALPAGGPRFMDPTEVARIDTRPDELLRRSALAEAQAGT